MGEHQHEFYTEILYIKFIFPLYHTLKLDLFSKIIAVTPRNSNRNKILDSVFCYLLFLNLLFCLTFTRSMCKVVASWIGMIFAVPQLGFKFQLYFLPAL